MGRVTERTRDVAKQCSAKVFVSVLAPDCKHSSASLIAPGVGSCPIEMIAGWASHYLPSPLMGAIGFSQ